MLKCLLRAWIWRGRGREARGRATGSVSSSPTTAACRRQVGRTYLGLSSPLGRRSHVLDVAGEAGVRHEPIAGRARRVLALWTGQERQEVVLVRLDVGRSGRPRRLVLVLGVHRQEGGSKTSGCFSGRARRATAGERAGRRTLPSGSRPRSVSWSAMDEYRQWPSGWICSGDRQTSASKGLAATAAVGLEARADAPRTRRGRAACASCRATPSRPPWPG